MYFIINIILLLLCLLALLLHLLNFLQNTCTPTPTDKFPDTNTAQTASSNSTPKLEHHDDHAREQVVPVEQYSTNTQIPLYVLIPSLLVVMYFIINNILLLLVLLSLLLHLLNFLQNSTSTPTPTPTDKFPDTNTSQTASSTSNSTHQLEHHEDHAREQVVPVEHSTNTQIPLTSEVCPVEHSTNTQIPLTSEVWEYDVFLSFRGGDTRKTFTDHLYQGLKNKGINTFRDNEKLESGKSISPELLTAIKQSMFAVVVLSKNYPSSTWCLEELAHIVECKRERGLTVLPVFHQVEPSEVRKQTGEYGEALAKHAQDSKDNIEKVKKWRKALTEVANLSGWDLKEYSYESTVVQQIVRRISKTLNNTFLRTNKDLVGMHSRIERVDKHMDLRSDDTRIIGIWGMGGSGKTTMAQEIFKKHHEKFEAAAFVANVRAESEKHDLAYLQKYLYESLLEEIANSQTEEMWRIQLGNRLRNKKVLIILDDIDKLKQIAALVPRRDDKEDSYIPLLGPGSRVIITTRDYDTLKKCGVQNENIYEVEKLQENEGFKLLCMKAFKKDSAPGEYEELVNRFVKYAAGLPLAVEVLGNDLNGKSVEQWKEALDRLSDDPDHEIFDVLQISYNGLKDKDKEIFLDIACFFRGEDQRRVKRILASCDFYPENGITTLIGKSLVELMERNKLWMHDLLQQMGWHIVRRQSYKDPGQRSRLWINYDELGNNKRSWLRKDARYVLTDNKGTNAVEGIFLNLPAGEEIKLKDDPFSKMENLRLLRFRNVKFSGFKPGSLSLSKKLRLFEWHNYPLESLPSSFQPDHLVVLKMPNSRIKQLSNGSRLSLKELQVLDLQDCTSLTESPDFSEFPKLQFLILNGCKKLSSLHPTIGKLKRLHYLDLRCCESLESLPDSICNLKSLHVLKLSGCSKLKQLPEIVGNNKKALKMLLLDGTAIRELPMSINPSLERPDLLKPERLQGGASESSKLASFLV